MTTDTGTGVLVTFSDGYSFYETLHGPVIETTCQACGRYALEAEYRQRQAVKDPPYTLCGKCQRDLWFPEEAR